MRFTTLLLSVAAVAGLGGCNTDGLWSDNQKVEGQMEDADSPEGINLPDIRIAEKREVDLVEEVLSHRAMYHRTLRLLRDYYRKSGYEDKRRWAETELAGVDGTEHFKYVLSAVDAGQLGPSTPYAS